MKISGFKIQNSHLRRTLCFAMATTVLMASMTGCGGKNARVGKSAAGGAAIGAGIGLLLGALTGNSRAAAAGAAIGAGVGAGQGAYEGWKQDQDDKRTEEITRAIREVKESESLKNADTGTRAREELTRFVGIWTLEGWLQESGQERISVKARVNGDIQMGYFIELAYIDMQVTGMDSQIWGTSTFGYDKEKGYNITTRFNTSPDPLLATGGTWDQTSRSFKFKGDDYRLLIQFDTPDRFVVKTYVPAGSKETQVEEYTFTRK